MNLKNICDIKKPHETYKFQEHSKPEIEIDLRNAIACGDRKGTEGTFWV